MLPIAQAAPTGTTEWLQVFFYLMGGFAACVVLYKSLRSPEPSQTFIGNQPLKVQTAAEYATKHELQQVRSEFRELRQENKDLTNRLQGEMKNDFAGVHDRITDLLAAFSEMRGEVREQKRSKSQT